MMKKYILLILMFIIAGCGAPKEGGVLSRDGLLCDFENIKIWDKTPDHGFKIRLDKEFKTRGNYSLKVEYPRYSLPNIHTKKLFSDWSKYDYLVFDVFNPQNEIVSIKIRIDDVSKNRVYIEYPLFYKQNTVKIFLKELSEKIDISNVECVALILYSPEKRLTLYFDNMKLYKKDSLVTYNRTDIAHPRLLFTKKDLPYLKEKLLSKRFFNLRNDLLNHALRKNDIYTLGFVYQVLGDKKCAKRAIKTMLERKIGKRPWGLEKFASAFDWCYDQMSEDEKRKLVRKIEKDALKWMNKKRHFRSFHNSMYAITTSIAAAGYALEGDSDMAERFIEFAASQYKDAILMFNNIFVDGGWPEGLNYSRHIAIHLLKYFEMVRTATGKNLYEECDWLLKNAYFVLYTTRPDNTFYRFSDSDIPIPTDWERRILARIASLYQDPYIQWYVNHKTKPHEVAYKHIYDVLWYDLELQEKTPQDLPKAKLFNGLGIVIARSGWGENSTWFSFKCGDYFGDHMHLDNNNFTIYKLGNLAIDSGLYGDAFDSSHWHNYYFRTIAHNSMLLYDPKEKFYGYARMRLANDGGQKIMLWNKGERLVPENYIYPDPALKQLWVENKEKWDIGDIENFKLTKEYCYMAGDATKSYASYKTKKYVRQILYIFPDYFIIFDEISSKNPNIKKKWVLHTVNEPKIKNDEIIIEEGNGTLFCKSLYPLQASINKVGGGGQEFLVEGKNYPHNDNFFSDNIPGNWRIEIEPETPKEDDVFLNFIYTSKINDKDMPKIEKIDTKNGIGVILYLENSTWTVFFNNEGISGFWIDASGNKSMIDIRKMQG